MWFPPYSDFLLIANGQLPSVSHFRRILSSPKTIVAVDGGLRFLSKIKCTPHLITGDFDSAPPRLLQRYSLIPQVKTPDQNKNDLEKALEVVFLYSPASVTVCGALGKRIDHTLANINLLARYPEQVVYESDEERCFALQPKRTIVKTRKAQCISLMPIGLVKEISTNGLKWELQSKDLNYNFFSLSNESLGEEIEINFREGILIICIKH